MPKHIPFSHRAHRHNELMAMSRRVKVSQPDSSFMWQVAAVILIGFVFVWVML